MASGDERWIPQVKGDEGKPSLSSLNETLRLIFQALHTLEGRVGEIALRDSVRVAGDVTLAERLQFEAPEEEPDVAEEDEMALYFDGTELLKSVDTGDWEPLITSSGGETPVTIPVTNGVPTTLFTAAFNPVEIAGGQIKYFVDVMDGSAAQAEAGFAVFSGLFDAGVETGDFVKGDSSQVLSNTLPNTLTVTFSTSVPAGGQVAYDVTVTSSLGTPTISFTYILTSYGDVSLT